MVAIIIDALCNSLTHELRTLNTPPLSTPHIKCNLCLLADNHTELDKVIILQYIIDGVICIQQTQTLAPAHNKARVLHDRYAAVVRFVLHVTFERLLSEPSDGAGGVSAGHGQPFISDMHGKTRHCASEGVRCSERCPQLSKVPPSTASDLAPIRRSGGEPRLNSATPQGITDPHRSVTQMLGHSDRNAFSWLNCRNTEMAHTSKVSGLWPTLKDPKEQQVCGWLFALWFLIQVKRWLIISLSTNHLWTMSLLTVRHGSKCSILIFF